MAVINIDGDLLFGSAAWVLRCVLREYMNHGDPREENVRRLIAAYLGVNHFDMRTWSHAEKESFRRSAKTCLDETIKNGPAAMHSPEGYPALITKLKELVDMLDSAAVHWAQNEKPGKGQKNSR